MMRVAVVGQGTRAARPALKALIALVAARRGRAIASLLLLAALWAPGALAAQVARSAPITTLAATSGEPWAWGANNLGQLGNGGVCPFTSGGASPVQTTGISNVVSIAAAGNHSLALTTDHTAWAWGDNTFGQLGDNSTACSAVPVPVGGLSGVTAIAAGGSHSSKKHLNEPGPQSGEDNLALLSNGTVWAWGANSYGQLGNHTTTSTCTVGAFTVFCSMTPVQVIGLPANDPVTAIAAGGDHNLALTASGAVWAWGDNASGQLGNGLSCVPSSGANCFTYTPQHVSVISNVVAIAAGDSHSLALTASGAVWAWGDNTFGQLGNGVGSTSTPVQVVGLPNPASNRVTAIAAGANHSLALTQDGTVWDWGQNSYGQLGVKPNSGSVAAPVHVGGLSGVTAIAGGGAHSLALTQGGAVWAWGADNDGQLGTTVSSTCIVNFAPVSCSGVPVQVSGLSGALAIAAGGNHSVALGPQPSISITPSSLDFGNVVYVYPTSGPTPPRTITIANNGGTAVTIGAVTVGPTFYGFNGTTTCNGQTLAPGQSCTVSVTFTPLFWGSFAGSVSIDDSAPGSPQSVALSGSGVAAATTTPAPSSPTNTATPAQTLTPTATATPTALLPSATATVAVPPPTFGSAPGGAILPTATPTAATGSSPPPTVQKHPHKTVPHKVVCKPAHTKSFPLVLHLSRAVVGGGPYLVGVQTGECAQVSMTLEASATHVTVSGKGKHRKRVSHTVVIFRASTHGGADGHGQFTGRLAVTYKPKEPLPAILTVSVHRGKSAKSYKAHLMIQPPPFITLGVKPGAVASGGTLTISVRTVANAHIVALLFVTGNKVVVTGTGKQRKRVTEQVEVYQTNLQGAADAHGAYKGRLHIGYKTAKPAQATLLVSASTAYGTASHTMRITIKPGHT